MNALILAAGQGSRLRPHTIDRPKCMVKLLGRPILDRQLCVLRRNGVERITLVAGYRADALTVSDVAVVVNPNYMQGNMVASLFCADRHMPEHQPLLVSYGDIVFEDRVLRAVLDCPGEIVVAADTDWRSLWEARMDEPLDDAESFRMVDGNRIVELGGPLTGYADAEAQFMGLLQVRSDKVAAFKAAYRTLGQKLEDSGQAFAHLQMTGFIQHLIDAGWDVRAALVANGWLEVDTAAELGRYHAMAERGTLNKLIRLD